MGRQYVHTASVIPLVKDNVPGIRPKRAYYFTIDLEKSVKDGNIWYRAPSGAILTKETVDPKYFISIQSCTEALAEQEIRNRESQFSTPANDNVDEDIKDMEELI